MSITKLNQSNDFSLKPRVPYACRMQNKNHISVNNSTKSQIPRIGSSVCSLFVPKNMSSSSNSEKEISPQSSEVLEDVNKRVKDVFDILNRETNRVRKEMEAFDEAAKKLEHVHFSKMLKLNVGGHLFSTSLATLNKDPGDFE